MKKIIIVDDEYLIRYSLSSVFRDSTIEVFTAANGETALGMIQENRIDLCFLDVHLPDMNGLDIMKRLRVVSPWTRVIIMTGSLITEAIMQSIHENAHCLISKPFDLDQVREAVGVILTPGKPRSPEKIVPINDESTIRWIADDYRKHLRNPSMDRITGLAVSLHDDATPVPVTADVLDISDSGMCIVTKSPLQPGHVIRLDNASKHDKAVVRWSEKSAASESCRAGIQFVVPLENITPSDDLQREPSA